MIRMRHVVTCAVIAICFSGSPDFSSRAGADTPAPIYCTLDASNAKRTGLEGIVVNGVCTPISAIIQGAPSAEYRTLGCTHTGQAVVHGVKLPNVFCDSNVPNCRLLVDGGQPGPNPIWAFENQVKPAGSSVWIGLGFYCPAAAGPTTVLTGHDIRDRAIRLLPKVAAVSTGTHSLVNIQTVLWAATASERDLGQVSVVGRRVWLRIAFEHAGWDFGDGSHESTTSPGKAYSAASDPCKTVMCPDYYGHVYRRTGTMTITLRVAWHASYSLDGTTFQPVDTAPITGPASTVTVIVRQARGVLVATGD